MKYVIEFEEEPMEIKVPNGMREYYPCINLPGLYLPQEDLDELTPYNREAIEDEVWEFAGHLINVSPSVTEDIYWSINGGKGIEVAVEMSYQEAKAKYDSWKKEKEEIHVGDEVGADDTPVIGIVTKVDRLFNRYHIVSDDGSTSYYQFHVVHKTGRHFPEVEDLLKKIGGEK